MGRRAGSGRCGCSRPVPLLPSARGCFAPGQGGLGDSLAAPRRAGGPAVIPAGGQGAVCDGWLESAARGGGSAAGVAAAAAAVGVLRACESCRRQRWESRPSPRAPGVPLGGEAATRGRGLPKAAAGVCDGRCFCRCRSASSWDFGFARMTAWVPSDALGRRVLCGTEYATVRYVGSVPSTAGKRRNRKKPLLLMVVLCFS